MIDANEYAKALFLLSEEENLTEEIFGDLFIVNDAIAANPAYEALLDTPALPVTEKLPLIDEAFSGIQTECKNFLKILCEKHAVFELPKIAVAFKKLYDTKHGIERVQAITAVPMNESQLGRMKEKLEEMTGKNILIENIVEPAVLGGVNLRYAGVQLDGTVKTKLDNLEKKLREVIVS